MIPDYLYNWVYIITIVLLCLLQSIRIRQYSSFNNLYDRSDPIQASLLLVVGCILFIGLRPISSVFPDMLIYAAGYKAKLFHISEIRNEPVWESIRIICNNLGLSVSSWFFLIAALSIGLKAYVCRKIFQNHIYIALLFIFSAFSFWSGAVTIIRNNLALGIAFLGVLLFLGDKRKKCIALILFTLAFYTHTSSFLLIICFLASYYFIKDVKWCIYFWMACILLSLIAGSFFENFFISLGFDDRFAAYLTNVNYKGFSHAGFRWDFLLYSMMPIILGWYIIRRCDVDFIYKVLINTYILANAFWLLVIRAQFSDRFAAISWYIYPIVIAYPILKFEIWDRQPNKVANILLLHVAFLLMMKIVYTFRF